MARIMLADDGDIIKKMLKEILTQEGHEIICEASNGEEAIENYTKYLPDLLLLDITMPIKDGLECLKTIFSRHPQAKIIMCSGINQTEILLRCLKEGAAGFIDKPFNPQKVLEVVNYTLAPEEIKSRHG